MRTLVTRETVRIMFNVIVIVSLIGLGAYGGYISAPPHILEHPCEINIQDLRLAQTRD